MPGRKGKNKNAGKVAGIIVGLLAAGVVGYVLHMFTAPPCNDTTIYITIDDKFGLSWNGTGFNSTYNCSIFGIDGILTSWNVFTAINAFFAANKTKMLGENNITSETGAEWVINGFDDLGYAENADMFGTPSAITRCEGRTAKFTVGEMVTMFPVAWVGVYYNGSVHYGDFTYAAVDTFAIDLAAGNLTRAVWNNATQYMWRSVDHVIIYDWQKVYSPNQLLTSFNGVNTTMISAMFMP
jgi:hypothetical protein